MVQINQRLRSSDPTAVLLRQLLDLGDDGVVVTSMRGGLEEDREWLYDASAIGVVIGTTDLIGSRLLFRGYRTTRWARPMFAGLLAMDTLIVVDEAHLSPAFVITISAALSQQRLFAGGVGTVGRLLPMTATPITGSTAAFELDQDDYAHPVVRKRMGLDSPTKLLEILPTDDVIASLASFGAAQDGATSAVLLFCDRRRDARAVAASLIKRLGSDRQADVRLLTGAIRGFERDALTATETFRAFTYLDDGRRDLPDDGRTRFLVCTSAGEVGVDLDSDACAMDLVSLERASQRLGRVGRRGAESAAPVELLVQGKADNKRAEQVAARLAATLQALESLPPVGGRLDASPYRLSQIDPDLRDRASTPPPVVPRLETWMIETLALTSINQLPAQPSLQPLLRGLGSDDEPRCRIAYRMDVPLLVRLVDDAEVERAFSIAPLRASEIVEVPSGEVAQVFKDHERKLAATAMGGCALLFVGGEFRSRIMIAGSLVEPEARFMRLPELAELAQLLEHATLILSPDVGCLDEDGAFCVHPTRDGLHCRQDLHIVHRQASGSVTIVAPGTARVLSRRFTSVLETDEGGNVVEALDYFVPWTADGDTALASTLQRLTDHHSDLGGELRRVAVRLGLRESTTDMILEAGVKHDLGKDRDVLQDAHHAPMEGRPYAKFASPRGGARLGGYRHEFGSIRDVLSANHKADDLVLHVIGAHHGRCRPILPPVDPNAVFTDRLKKTSLEAALRYVRLQRRFGPWGLAWLEAIVRSADARVSRRLDHRPNSDSPAARQG